MATFKEEKSEWNDCSQCDSNYVLWGFKVKLAIKLTHFQLCIYKMLIQEQIEYYLHP